MQEPAAHRSSPAHGGRRSLDETLMRRPCAFTAPLGTSGYLPGVPAMHLHGCEQAGRHEMVLWEILIDGVFVAALLTSVACLAYVVYATILERHLLRARQAPVCANAAGAATRTASSPAAVTPAAFAHTGACRARSR